MDEDAVKPIETALKTLIKQVLSIAGNTGDPLLPALSGILPAQAAIEMNALAMLGSILRNPNSLEHKLAHRHLAVRQESSWFQYAQEILVKLDLPSLDQLLSQAPSKNKWKATYRRATHLY